MVQLINSRDSAPSVPSHGRSVNREPTSRSHNRRIVSLFFCCTIQAAFFMQCHITSSRPKGGPEDTLKERVSSLEHERLGPSSLGTAVAMPTDNTEYIISQKERAIPLLVEALKQKDKPVLVGYAAYCLRRLASDQGEEAAASVYSELSKKGPDITYEERFALGELAEYLEFLKTKKNK